MGREMTTVVFTVRVMTDLPPDNPAFVLPRGEYVRTLLEQLAPGLTMEAVSVQMGMPERFISDLLGARGPAAKNRLPNAAVVRGLARVLQCPERAVLMAFARDAGLSMVDGLTPPEQAVIAKATSLPRRLRARAFSIFEATVDGFASDEMRERWRRKR